MAKKRRTYRGASFWLFHDIVPNGFQFLTDGRAVDYQEAEEPGIPDESDTSEDPSPSSPGTGSVAPAAMLLTLRKQRKGR